MSVGQDVAGTEKVTPDAKHPKQDGAGNDAAEDAVAEGDISPKNLLESLDAAQGQNYSSNIITLSNSAAHAQVRMT